MITKMTEKIRKSLTAFSLFLCLFSGSAQGNHSYWQQAVDYTMAVNMDVEILIY